MKVPHHTKYCIVDEETNILLTGVPDEVFLCEDGSFAIIDYKTARYTAHQNNLNDKDNVRSLFALGPKPSRYRKGCRTGANQSQEITPRSPMLVHNFTSYPILDFPFTGQATFFL